MTDHLAEVIPLLPVRDAGAAPHDPYKLSGTTERLLVQQLCVSSKLWAQIGRHLDPKALADPVCTLLVEACVAIVTDTGRPPAYQGQVIQRLSRWRAEGKITIDAVIAAQAIVGDAAEGTGARAGVHDALVAEMKPILLRAYNKEFARLGVDNLSKRGDRSDARAIDELAQQVGEAPAIAAGASRLGLDSIPEFTRQAMRARSLTGISELDLALRGGMPCGSLGTFLGNTGAGKSMSLLQAAAINALTGKVVHVLTGELSVKDWEIRLLAHLFAVPINAIREEPRTRIALQERIEELASWFDTSVRIYTSWFSPKSDSPRSIAQAVDDMEQKEGDRVDVVIVDYADKLRPNKSVHKDDKGYLACGDVYESLRLYAEETKRWVWTATQATREKKRKVLEVEDMSDSFEKARVADLIVTINPEPLDRTQIKWGVPKFRHGEDHLLLGPLPSDYACARVALVDDKLYPTPGIDE
jgi:hypothetical protein